MNAGADPEAGNPRRLALLTGLPEIAALLPEVAPLSSEDQFIAACAAADAATAKHLATNEPASSPVLTAEQLGMLPRMVEIGNTRAARLMVELGWPIAAIGGDWNATALNLAVFRGDAQLAAFLLDHGASWQERHGYNDNVVGTLSFASKARPAHGGDWLACAATLIQHGMPTPPEGYSFSPEIEKYFAHINPPSV